MKFILSILLILCISVNSYAKKIYYPLEVVACMAELIVYGEIESVGKSSYELKIQETIKGQEFDVIKVQMFEEWVCDVRAKKPEIGDKLILFLSKENGKYEIINGSTGEMLVENGAMIGLFEENQPTVNEFTKALKTFTLSFKLKSNEYNSFNETVFIQLKSDNEINILFQESELTNWFFESIKKYKIEKER
jgi:hypothetical protein